MEDGRWNGVSELVDQQKSLENSKKIINEFVEFGNKLLASLRNQTTNIKVIILIIYII